MAIVQQKGGPQPGLLCLFVVLPIALNIVLVPTSGLLLLHPDVNEKLARVFKQADGPRGKGICCIEGDWP